MVSAVEALGVERSLFDELADWVRSGVEDTGAGRSDRAGWKAARSRVARFRSPGDPKNDNCPGDVALYVVIADIDLAESRLRKQF